MKLNSAINKIEDIAEYIKEYDIKDLKELADLSKVRSLLKKNEEIEEKKKNNTVIWIFAIVGIVVVCAAIGYCIYKYLVPDYLEDFDDDFEDFDDDFFEDDDDLTNWDDDDEVEVERASAKEDESSVTTD